MASTDPHYIYMGTITKPHGIRGEMSLHTSAEKPKILLGQALLAHPSNDTLLDTLLPAGAKQITVASVRMHHQMALITIEGVKDRTEAEKYRRYRLFIERQKLSQLNEDEYYQTDLLGLDVFAENLDDGSYLGQLSSIDAPAGQELWTITTDDDQEILLPAVPEFVSIIDLDEEYIIITPPPGLLDLYIQPASSTEQDVAEQNGHGHDESDKGESGTAERGLGETDQDQLGQKEAEQKESNQNKSGHDELGQGTLAEPSPSQDK